MLFFYNFFRDQTYFYLSLDDNYIMKMNY